MANVCHANQATACACRPPFLCHLEPPRRRHQARLGAARLETAKCLAKPLAFCPKGQRVPNSTHTAHTAPLGVPEAPTLCSALIHARADVPRVLPRAYPAYLSSHLGLVDDTRALVAQACYVYGALVNLSLYGEAERSIILADDLALIAIGRTLYVSAPSHAHDVPAQRPCRCTHACRIHAVARSTVTAPRRHPSHARPQSPRAQSEVAGTYIGLAGRTEQKPQC